MDKAPVLPAGIHRIAAGPAAMAASVDPVSTIVLATLVLGEPMTFMQLVVLTSVGLIEMGRTARAS